MSRARALAFNLAFFAWTAVLGTIGLPFLLAPRRLAMGFGRFWASSVLALLLSVKVRLFMLGGAGAGGLDTLWHLTLPALTIALHISPILVRALRSSLIEVMDSDYVTTGLAMGLRPVTLLVSYLLRNALTPFISVLGLNIGWLIGGTIIIEQVFGIPGVGSLLITSILTRDYSIVQFVTLVLAFLVILVNLLTDLAYAALDPRVSFQR